MEVDDYYLRLRKQYPDRKDGQPFPVTLDELSEALDCTRRNAQLLIQKMSERNYVQWLSGRGRGNRSSLAFLKDQDELLLRKAKSLAEQGEVNEALQWVKRYSNETLRAEFQEWLLSQFGMHKRSNEEDVLRFPFYRPIPDLDPLNVIRRTEAHLIRQIFDTLVVYDTVGRIHKPGLAHYWEHDESKTLWTFYLRKGVVFHHGKRMSAEDVKFTLERIKQEKPNDWLMANVETIELLGATCIRIRLREPNGLFLSFLAAERFSIVPSDLERLGATRDFKRMPVGTGPFRISENTDSLLVLEANDRYYGGRPYLDRVETWIWPDYEDSAESESYSLADTQVLYFEAVDRKETGRVLKRAEDGSVYMTFNLNRNGPLKDSRVREAIHLALDRVALVRELGGRRLKPSAGFDPMREETAYGKGDDIRKASELVAQSDYRGEALKLYTYSYSANEEDAAWIRRRLERIGIELEVTVLPIRELTSEDAMASSDLILAGEVLGDDPEVTLIDMYRSRPGYIRNHMDPYARGWLDATLSAALAEENAEARVRLMRSIEEELRDRRLLLFLYHSHQTVGVDPSLSGISLNAWGKINYKDIWLKENH